MNIQDKAGRTNRSANNVLIGNSGYQQVIELDGEWILQQAGKNETLKATVPGSVHSDLLAAGKIPDPYYRDNEDSLQWIGEVDWIYRRSFEVPEDFLRQKQILLRCEGLDTMAAIKINSQQIAKTDNMFRAWEFEVKDALKAGKNTIEIRFASTIPYIKKHELEHHIPLSGPPHGANGGNWLRKEQCNFGWDWGPCLLTCGIWRPIKLIAGSGTRIKDIDIKQKHAKDGSVTLDITTEVTSVGKTKVNACVVISRGECKIIEGTAPFKGSTSQLAFSIDSPELWWPNDMGSQPLYIVTVNLLEQNGRILDTQSKRIGLRTLHLQRKEDKWGESFQFVVNGIPFFAKGACWIPADTFASHLTDADYTDLIRSAAAAHMNMLRVWGGGFYEADIFYELCDKLGICVWQDFMFACATYPTFDKAFLDSFQAEAVDNIRRLRHHPSLALWCGNNELEQGWVG